MQENLSQFLPFDDEVLNDHNTDGGNRSDSEWEDEFTALAKSSQAEKERRQKSHRIIYQDPDDDDNGWL